VLASSLLNRNHKKEPEAMTTIDERFSDLRDPVDWHQIAKEGVQHFSLPKVMRLDFYKKRTKKTKRFTSFPWFDKIAPFRPGVEWGVEEL
jgi:hypothetical protein